MLISVWRVGACPLRRVWDAQVIRVNVRSLFSETGVWERDYKAETRRRVEKCWHGRIQEQWQKDEVHQVSQAIIPYVTEILYQGFPTLLLESLLQAHQSQLSVLFKNLEDFSSNILLYIWNLWGFYCTLFIIFWS